ncbi:hypothetical protein LguiA_021156 [Lonicera macranthoides]
MKLTFRNTLPLSSSYYYTTRLSKLKDCNALQRNSSFSIFHKSKEVGVKVSIISAGLPETAASIAFAAMVVGAAGTLLVRRTKASEATKAPSKICGNCGGSGICPECRGEGFVPKKLSDGSAEKARLTAKNMATRHTVRLPKKWSYYTKCFSTQSCNSCGGSGKLSL